MKIFMLILLFSSAAFAGSPAQVQLPRGMTVAAFTPEATHLVRATMDCDLYKIVIQNGVFKGSELMAASHGQPFKVGEPQFTSAKFPPPFQDISVVFNHTMSAFGESGFGNYQPYIQAFFMNGNQVSSDVRDAGFDISSAQVGSKITLRGTYDYNSDVTLTYQCSMNFVP